MTEPTVKSRDASAQTDARASVARILYLTAGILCVALAFLGTILPVLPTTPFLLLASICFVRSSPALNEWLLRSRLFGPFLRDWQRHHGVRLHVKLTAVFTIALVVAASIWSGRVVGPLLYVLIGLAGIGLWVVLRLPLIRENARDPKGG